MTIPTFQIRLSVLVPAKWGITRTETESEVLAKVKEGIASMGLPGTEVKLMQEGNPMTIPDYLDSFPENFMSRQCDFVTIYRNTNLAGEADDQLNAAIHSLITDAVARETAELREALRAFLDIAPNAFDRARAVLRKHEEKTP